MIIYSIVFFAVFVVFCWILLVCDQTTLLFPIIVGSFGSTLGLLVATPINHKREVMILESIKRLKIVIIYHLSSFGICPIGSGPYILFSFTPLNNTGIISPNKGISNIRDHRPGLLRSWNLLIARLHNGTVIRANHNHIPSCPNTIAINHVRNHTIIITDKLPIIYSQRLILCSCSIKNATLRVCMTKSFMGLSRSVVSAIISCTPTAWDIVLSCFHTTDAAWLALPVIWVTVHTISGEMLCSIWSLMVHGVVDVEFSSIWWRYYMIKIYYLYNLCTILCQEKIILYDILLQIYR